MRISDAINKAQAGYATRLADLVAFSLHAVYVQLYFLDSSSDSHPLTLFPRIVSPAI
jgi:hypothetical protein